MSELKPVSAFDGLLHPAGTGEGVNVMQCSGNGGKVALGASPASAQKHGRQGSNPLDIVIIKLQNMISIICDKYLIITSSTIILKHLHDST